MLGGVVIIAVAVIAVVIVVSISGNKTAGKPVNPVSATAKSDATAVSNLLAGIPETGETLGSPSAPITITEYGDLECPDCDAFALPTNRDTSDGTPGSGYLDQLISQYVRTGKVKIVYRSLETASGGVNNAMWPQQQASAYAAGLQNKAWYYIELFYYEQQPETTTYVNTAFLQGIAEQVPGLSLSEWAANSQSPTLEAQVASDGRAANAQGFSSTPTLVVRGPKGEANPIQGVPPSFSDITSEINAVS